MRDLRFLVCTLLKHLCRGYWICLFIFFSYFCLFCVEDRWWILSQCSCSVQILLMVHYGLYFWSFCSGKYRIIIINVLLLVVSLGKFLLASQQTWWKLGISFSFPVHLLPFSASSLFLLHTNICVDLFSACRGSSIFLPFT